MYKGFLLFLTFYVISFTGLTQDTLRTRKVKPLIAPSFGYAPETSGTIGAVALFDIDMYQDGTRPSFARSEFTYTLKNQILWQSRWNYFTRRAIWNYTGLFDISKYIDNYYGLGPKTSLMDEVKYQNFRVALEAYFNRHISGNSYVGLGLRFNHQSHFEPIKGYELTDRLTTTNSIGATLQYMSDSRNSMVTPTRGHYLQAIQEFNFNLGHNFYSRSVIDFRKYMTVDSHQKHILYVRGYHVSTWGTPPFYDYGLLGGDQNTRGYFYGRYRDKNLTVLQLEYRTPYIWRFGLALFGGTGIIYNDFSNLNLRSFKPNAGVGLRFLFNRIDGTNLRVDYGIGENGQKGIYISFGESF